VSAAAAGAARPLPRLPVRPEWLAQRHEPILDPALPIVDAHHPLWEVPGIHYLLPDFLLDVASGHDVCASVFMQSHVRYRREGPAALRCVGETEYVRAVTADETRGDEGGCRVAAGIVGEADLLLGAAVARQLEAHLEAGGGRFRGVRHLANWHDDPAARGTGNAPPHLLLEPQFRAGFARLQPLGLTFDAWVYHTQLHEVADLAAHFPGTAIIIDHAGGPVGVGPYAGRRDAVFAAWRAAMRALAAYPNVFVKLGGLGMRLFGADFHEQARPPSSAALAGTWGPYFETCIEAFGAGRCMFESNAPVDKGTASYPVLWNAFKRATAGCSAAERRALFGGTAAAVYRLDVPRLRAGQPA
jgi:predicted TIM-barrel fold metal-dependent hydrolase